MSLSEREKSLLCIAALLAAALLAFAPCLFNDFLFMDDPQLVWQNPLVRDFSWPGVVRIFFHPPADFYMPMVFLTYSIEHHFFGYEPTIYHATNILLHACNAGLVFLFLKPFFKSPWPAFAAALLFAVHPLHVEAVAWVSQRKDVLFLFFAVLSMILHTRRVRAGYPKGDAPALVAFTLALLSKPMAVTLPVLFVLIDVCLLEKEWRASIRSKAPFFLLAAAFSVWTVIVFAKGGHIRKVGADWWAGIPPYGLLLYFLKTILPHRLAAFYPFPGKDDPLFLAAPFAAAALAAVLLFLRKYPRIFFGPAFFILALLPVLQFVPVGHAPVADRYAYLPSIGLLFIFAEAVAFTASKGRAGRLFTVLVTFTVFVSFLNLTYDRCKVWRNVETLYSDNIVVYPKAHLPYNCRADYYYVHGRLDEALADINRAIAVQPDYAYDFYLRSIIHGSMGRVRESLEDADRAITLCPICAEFYSHRGAAYGHLGRYEEAAVDFQKSLEIDPSNAQAWRDLKKTREFIKTIKN